MFIIQDYFIAILFCFVTMLCWGSWGNTQKLAAKTWRYEFFYWDYVLGLLLFPLFRLYFGQYGRGGARFCCGSDASRCRQYLQRILGGVIFNASNILLSAAIALCGMSVAFPVGVGLALVLGVVINYFGAAKGEPLYILSVFC